VCVCVCKRRRCWCWVLVLCCCAAFSQKVPPPQQQQQHAPDQKNGLRLLATRMSPRGNGGNARARANHDTDWPCTAESPEPGALGRRGGEGRERGEKEAEGRAG
jgi:hypothetical protein